MALSRLRSLASISLLGPRLYNIQKPVALIRFFSDNAVIKSKDGRTAVAGPRKTELVRRASYMAGVFGGSAGEMEKYLKSNRFIVSINWGRFENCIQILKANGVKKEDILACSTVFLVSISSLESQIKTLREKGLDLRLSLLDASPVRCRSENDKLEIKRQFGNHETMLKILLDCSEEQAQDVLEKYKWIKNTNLPTLKMRIELLRRYDVSGEAIRNGFSVTRFSRHRLERRLSYMKQHGVSFPDFPKVFLSFLNKQEAQFQISMAKLLTDRAILDELGCRNTEEYLMKRLRCGERDLHYMKHQGFVLNIRDVRKLKENLDFLLDTCKFTPEKIINKSICLTFSNAMLRRRFEILRDNDIEVTISLMTRRAKDFNITLAAAVFRRRLYRAGVGKHSPSDREGHDSQPQNP